MPHDSDSQAQRDVERIIVEAVSRECGLPLRHPFPVRTATGAVLIFDGGSDDPAALCEVYAHCGTLRGAQPDKVMTDALRLLFARERWNRTARLILAFCDHNAAGSFRGGSWMKHALDAFRIEVCVVEVPQDARARIEAAQRLQAAPNRRADGGAGSVPTPLDDEPA